MCRSADHSVDKGSAMFLGGGVSPRGSAAVKQALARRSATSRLKCIQGCGDHTGSAAAADGAGETAADLIRGLCQLRCLAKSEGELEEAFLWNFHVRFP
jgi:hypothetical protein